MSERGGYIKIWRKAKNNQLWYSKPFDRWHAWEDLIEKAAWKSHEVFYRGHAITLKRGQWCTSLRQLGRDWGWGIDKVILYVRTLEKLGMIRTETRQGIKVITLLNYGRYQDADVTTGQNADENPTANRQPTDSQPTANRQPPDTTEESIKTGEEREEGKEGGSGTQAAPPPLAPADTGEAVIIKAMEAQSILGSAQQKRDHIKAWRARGKTAGEIEAIVMRPDSKGRDIFDLHKEHFKDGQARGFTHDIACPRCKRTGLITQVVGGRYEDTVNCPDCKGTGYRSAATT